MCPFLFGVNMLRFIVNFSLTLMFILICALLSANNFIWYSYLINGLIFVLIISYLNIRYDIDEKVK